MSRACCGCIPFINFVNKFSYRRNMDGILPAGKDQVEPIAPPAPRRSRRKELQLNDLEGISFDGFMDTENQDDHGNSSADGREALSATDDGFSSTSVVVNAPIKSSLQLDLGISGPTEPDQSKSKDHQVNTRLVTTFNSIISDKSRRRYHMVNMVNHLKNGLSTLENELDYIQERDEDLLKLTEAFSLRHDAVRFELRMMKRENANTIAKYEDQIRLLKDEITELKHNQNNPMRLEFESIDEVDVASTQLVVGKPSDHDGLKNTSKRVSFQQLVRITYYNVEEAPEKSFGESFELEISDQSVGKVLRSHTIKELEAKYVAADVVETPGKDELFEFLQQTDLELPASW